jgi:hypothetical protein
MKKKEMTRLINFVMLAEKSDPRITADKVNLCPIFPCSALPYTPFFFSFLSYVTLTCSVHPHHAAVLVGAQETGEGV